MSIFLIFLFATFPILYKINNKCIIQDQIISRFNKQDSYLNNLLNYEYHNTMKNYYYKNIQNHNIEP